jgi:hypothetical protein
MYLMKTAELLYKIRETCTAIELLFPASKLWSDFLHKIKLKEFHGLANQAHNELVAVRGCMSKQGTPFAWDYNAFKSRVEIHRNFDDPMRNCSACRSSVRMIPTAKNILMKKFGFKSHKNAVLLAVD